MIEWGKGKPDGNGTRIVKEILILNETIGWRSNINEKDRT